MKDSRADALSGIYLISPPAISASFSLDLARTLAVGHVSLFQLRLKDIALAAYAREAKECMRICRDYHVPLIVNDAVDIMQDVGADGVHIGEEDMALSDAKERLPASAIIGISCYNRMEDAENALEQGVDYVSFGAFYTTETKIPKTRAELSLLTQWKAKRPNIPTCAIGGINADNIAKTVEAGADLVAVSGYVWRASDGPEHALARLWAALGR